MVLWVLGVLFYPGVLLTAETNKFIFINLQLALGASFIRVLLFDNDLAGFATDDVSSSSIVGAELAIQTLLDKFKILNRSLPLLLLFDLVGFCLFLSLLSILLV